MSALLKEHHPLVPIEQGDPLMAAIANAASNPAVDVDKMERLLSMYEKMQDRRAAQDYAEAMTAAQAEIPKIIKDRKNGQADNDYATLDAINKVIVPIYTRHNLNLSFGTEDCPIADHVRIVCNVKHASGHTETHRYDTPLDSTGIAGKVNKTGTHARGSAVTYGRRYLTLMIFNLSTGYDDDGNGADIDRITEEQAAILRDMLDATNSDKARFLGWLKVDSIESIPAKAYKSAFDALKAKERAK